MPEMMKAEEFESGHYSILPSLVARIADITGLDWFVTELVATEFRRDLKVLIVEPANALAGLGPGLKPLSHMPAEVARLAAERIVQIAWRHARKLPLRTGKVIRMAS